MVRARLASLTVAICLGSITGCLGSWSQHSLFDRLRGVSEGPCCGPEGCLPEGAAFGGDSGPILVPPNAGPGDSLPAPVAPNTVPPLTAPPNGRLVPQPQPQAAPMPYTPGNGK